MRVVYIRNDRVSYARYMNILYIHGGREREREREKEREIERRNASKQASTASTENTGSTARTSNTTSITTIARTTPFDEGRNAGAGIEMSPQRECISILVQDNPSDQPANEILCQ